MDKTIFTYKSDGSFTTVNTDVQFSLKVTGTYDKKGHQLTYSIPDGTVFKYTYNAKGQMISYYTIPVQGEKRITATFTYNAKGKMTASEKKEGYSSKTVNAYDTNGLLKKEIATWIVSGERSISTKEYEYGY